jgi:hypothetical protein
MAAMLIPRSTESVSLRLVVSDISECFVPARHTSGSGDPCCYVSDNPLNRTDPTGLCSQPINTSYTFTITANPYLSSALTGIGAGSAASLLSPTSRIVPSMSSAAWGTEACASWFDSLPTRNAPTGNEPWMVFQRTVAGPTEYHIQGLESDALWADSIQGTRIIDAKMVENPANSAQLGTSSQWFQEKYLARMTDEFGRMKSAIADPTNPLTSVEVRVNTQQSVPFWESLLRDQGIPGRVVVPGGVGPAASEVPTAMVMKSPTSGFVRNNAGALGFAVGLSAVNGVATAINHLADDVSVKAVTNPETDPWDAMQSVQFLRERHNEPRGLVYTLWNLPNWQEESRQHAQGNQWLDQAEQYWKGRQEAVIQANMPVRGSAAPVPH